MNIIHISLNDKKAEREREREREISAQKDCRQQS